MLLSINFEGRNEKKPASWKFPNGEYIRQEDPYIRHCGKSTRTDNDRSSFHAMHLKMLWPIRNSKIGNHKGVSKRLKFFRPVAKYPLGVLKPKPKLWESTFEWQREPSKFMFLLSPSNSFSSFFPTRILNSSINLIAFREPLSLLSKN